MYGGMQAYEDFLLKYLPVVTTGIVVPPSDHCPFAFVCGRYFVRATASSRNAGESSLVTPSPLGPLLCGASSKIWDRRFIQHL